MKPLELKQQKLMSNAVGINPLYRCGARCMAADGEILVRCLSQLHALNPAKPSFIRSNCTLPRGHVGPHVACVIEDTFTNEIIHDKYMWENDNDKP